jgi:lipoyl(octanoyl) transferase
VSPLYFRPITIAKMELATSILAPALATDAALQVYLLGSVEFEAGLALQRRLVYDVAGDKSQNVLVVCEHPPAISMGRQASWTHVRWDPEELQHRRWRTRWINRGGGCMLHVPGQLAVYPILPLDRLGFGLQAYIDRLQDVVLELLADFSIHGHVRPGRAGVWVNQRLLAGVGIAVRDWVSYYGMWINVCPDLELFRRVRCSPDTDLPMTSLARERRGSPHIAMVRQRLVEHFAERFSFARTALFFEHPTLSREPRVQSPESRAGRV